MRIVAIGGGPAALYFGILMKEADPAHEITILERNRLDDTFGFGVVFSDATQNNLAAADPVTYDALAHEFFHWDNIDIHYRGQVIRSGGHGFSGVARRKLLQVLGRRCEALGACVEVGEDIKDVELYRRRADLLIGADGFNSTVRERYAEHFQPSMDERPNRFVWLGTTRPFPAFTFYFKRDQHGLWRVHAYQYEPGHSTFIVEATEQTWRSAGLDKASENDTVKFCETLFKEELQGHRLLKNRSLWRNFVTIKNAIWSHENVVLVGDAAHTAHFSVGSGTKLAIEDAIALAGALQRERDVPAALAAYEVERRPAVESLQRAAQVSLQWFEDTERYMNLEPLQFAFNLLTRSLRITHDNLKVRDPQFVEKIDEWYAEQAAKQSHV
ncbi:MAG TPA: FAD-dependent monooxygenase, partial [Gemmatimonadales bacterium]|nr:FAD-dependent monooxygenase [Gemmatimonadales bacterium]